MSQEAIRDATLALHKTMAAKSMGSHDPDCAAPNCLIVAAAVFEGVYPTPAEFDAMPDEVFDAYLVRIGFAQRIRVARYEYP